MDVPETQRQKEQISRVADKLISIAESFDLLRKKAVSGDCSKDFIPLIHDACVKVNDALMRLGYELGTDWGFERGVDHDEQA